MSDRSTLADLRRLRRDRRLGDVEWFDVAYRVYLFALVGTAVVIWASDLVDGIADDVGRDELLAVGPGVAGIAAALAVSFGLRHGAEGGPIAVEPGDVRHLLGAPVDRRLVMARPIVQRMRSVAFGAAVVLAIAGQLAGRELVGSRAAWAGAGLLFGVVVGVGYVAIAVVAHTLKLPRSLVGPIGAVLVVWQIATVVGTWRAVDDDTAPSAAVQWGPFDLVGSLALWGVRQRPIDVIAIAIVVVLAAAAVALGGWLRIEPLERRGQLVSQLRFAATTQDIRTVVQLRRQLSAEALRARPWFARAASSPPDATGSTVDRTRPASRPTSTAPTSTPSWSVVVQRGVASMRRFPSSRLVRLAGTFAVAGVAAHAAVEWTPLAYVVVAGALYIAGLELVEPLAQEVDRPDRTDGLPVDRSALFARHLIVPALAAVPFALVGAAVATAFGSITPVAAFALALPVAWGGMIGGIATTVGDAARPATVANTTLLGADRLADNPFAVPEFAGFGSLVSGLVPIVLSGVAVVPIVATDIGESAGAAVRGVVAVALCLAVLVWWVRRRDRWAVAVRQFFIEGRAVREAAT